MWYMIKVLVSTDVPQPRDEVYAFLDVMANHVVFTDHMLHEWELSGPERGVGARARVKTRAGGRIDVIDIEVTAGQAPTTIVERNIGANGRRQATGTYRLAELPAGGTRVEFEWACRQAPFSERLLAPMIARILRRENQKAMVRLASALAGRPLPA